MSSQSPASMDKSLSLQHKMNEAEPSELEQMHHPVNSAWASFLSAQHCTHEVSILRRALEDHMRDTSLSLVSLQQDIAHRHELVAVSVLESKSNVEQMSSEVRELGALKHTLTSLQREVTEVLEQSTRNFTQFTSHQRTADERQSQLPQEIRALQNQYRSALEMVEFLQGELRGMRAEKLEADRKLQNELKEMRTKKLEEGNKLRDEISNMKTGNFETARKLESLKRQVDAELQHRQEPVPREIIQSLQREISEIRAERIETEANIATLGSQVLEATHSRQELSQEMVEFLNQMLLRREELMMSLDKAKANANTRALVYHDSQSEPRSSLPNVSPTNPDLHQHSPNDVDETEDEFIISFAGRAPYTSATSNAAAQQSEIATTRTRTKRKAEESIQAESVSKRIKSAVPSATIFRQTQEIQDIYHTFREKYRTDPPENDVKFIWELIASIGNQETSDQIQELLATSFPDCVTRKRGRPSTKDPWKRINISKGLTWNRFRGAFNTVQAYDSDNE